MSGFPGASYDAWKTTEPDCPTCGDSHSHDACTYVVTCRCCDAESANPEAPFADRRCSDCAAAEARNAKREQRLAQEGWI